MYPRHMAIVNKSSGGKRGPKFVTAAGGTGVRTGKDGGKNLGTPTHCVAERAHRNVKSY